jgi:signal transduction histidine kinase
MVETWSRFPVVDELPVGRAMLTRAGVYCASRAERDALFPAMADVGSEPSHAMTALPLRTTAEPFGALVFSFPGDHEFVPDERLFLETLAAQCAQALDRAELFERLRNAREAAERRADAAAALAFVADGICLVDTEGAVRLWNDAAMQITGVPAFALLGLPIEHQIPQWRELEPRIPVTPAGQPAPRPLTLPIELGGQERWLSISGVRFEGGAVYAFRDVTEEQGLEAMKRDFIATVSHELRTPLSAVYGAASTLRNRPSLGPEEREQFLVMIEEQSERLSRIVNEILTASRIDSGELSVALTSVDGVGVTQDVLAVVRRGAGAGFRLDLQLQPGVPHVLADPDRLRQVLGNLVENAVKYSGSSRVVEVEVQHDGGRVRFVVRDFGIGIAPSERPRIFEKFYRVDPGMNSGVSGTGLGLYIVRELVSRMNGTIDVAATDGGGSTFVVELPAVV